MAFDHSQLAIVLYLCHSLNQSAALLPVAQGGTGSRRGRVCLPTSLNPSVKRSLLHPNQEIQRQPNSDPPTYMHYWTLKPMQTHSHTKWSTKERILFAHGTHPCKSTISTAKQTVCVYLSTSSQTLTHTHAPTDPLPPQREVAWHFPFHHSMLTL